MPQSFIPGLLGPNGEPITTVRKVSLDEARRIAGDPETIKYVLDNVMVQGDDYVGKTEEVEKKVRSRGTSLQQVWDPTRGKPKPTSVTYTTLRQMANRSEWAQAIIKTRKNQIGDTKWAVKPKDEEDSSPSTKKLCDEVTKLLKRPSMYGSRPSSRSWRQFVQEFLDDLLVLDAGCIEKERNLAKWVLSMYPVDGATIQPNIDQYGGYHDDAYVQIVDGMVVARFGMEDLVYAMDNPQTDVRFMGYGYSPMEHLIVSVCAELYASKYNSSYFEKGAVPEGLLNLGEETTPEDVDEFRLYWMNEIMGKPWAIPIIGGKGVEWVEWRQSNKDMEYMAYQNWLVKKMCAVYQIAPQEIGLIEDVNRSTADEQEGSNQSTSVEPILALIEDVWEVEIIGEHGLGVGDIVKFEFDRGGEDETILDTLYKARVDAGAWSRNEWREAVGDEPSEEEGADMLLVAGQLNPLPTEQDIAVMGAAAQQQQQKEQQEQQMDAMQEQGSGPGTMPWKPAQPGDKDTQAAMGQHNLEQGVGPKQMPLGKTSDVEKALSWTKSPGGKNYSATLGRHQYHVVRQNTAAGGLRWHAYHTDPFGTQRMVHRGDDFKVARAAVEAHAAGLSVGKTTDPAMDDHEESLTDVFDRGKDRLLSDLEKLLGVPLSDHAATL
jgi:hypothetical protein